MNDDGTLTIDEYQSRTMDTAIYPEAGDRSVMAVIYVALGLAGEAGEIANKAKKILRDGTALDQFAKDARKEIGDAAWYLARLCDELDTGLSEVLAGNLAKLADRKARGVLRGSGDNR